MISHILLILALLVLYILSIVAVRIRGVHASKLCEKPLESADDDDDGLNCP